MSVYPNYLEIQRQNEIRKLQEAQSRLAQLDQQSQLQLYQPIQQQNNGLSGRIVNDFSEIQAKDIPMDNYGAEFIKSDMSEIEIRRWSNDGKIVPMRFKRVYDDNPNNSTPNVENANTDKIDTLTLSLQAEFEAVNERLSAIENIISPQPQPKRKKVSTDEQTNA